MPPGSPYDDGEPRIGALDLPTELDPDPPAALIEAVCDGVAGQAEPPTP